MSSFLIFNSSECETPKRLEHIISQLSLDNIFCIDYIVQRHKFREPILVLNIGSPFMHVPYLRTGFGFQGNTGCSTNPKWPSRRAATMN